jgi:outer membrane protein insertion porin family
LHTNDNYGQGFGSTKYFPFMYNYYAGGIDTVPGFSSNTLGPKDRWGNALGGNESVAFGMDLVFPNHLGNTVRTSITLDGGNVYNSFLASTGKTYNPDGKSTDTDSGTLTSYSGSGPMRYSVGLRVQWQMPMLGTVSFAVAKALNAQHGDNTSWFNFNFGTSF